ncbi:zinc-binding alcohol dehydrogenase family protein [Galbibacter sp. BG1]
MKAIVITQSGEPSQLQLIDRPIPKVRKNEVLIKVKALGLNRSEIMTRKGYSPNVTFPRILGIECVGEVVEDPSGTILPGQKVAAFMGGMGRDFDGSYAEYVSLPKWLIQPFDSTLPWKVLGALPEMFQTAYGSLYNALNIDKGDCILIRGGTSSVGLLALQLAKLAGLYVIATTRSQHKQQLLLDQGVDDVWIDNGCFASEIQLNKRQKVNKVLELVGTATLKDSLQCTVNGGIVCMTGMLAEQWVLSNFIPMEDIPSSVYLTCYDSGQQEVNSENFQEFVRQVENGLINPKIKGVYMLEDMVAAHTYMEENADAGKIVILT